MNQISITIPTYERVAMTIESFYDVYSDERIKNIIIVDDASSTECYEELKSICRFMPKVILYRNEINQDCYKNKATSISYSTTPYAVLLDSDNIISKSYIDSIYSQEWDEETILAPDWAMPTFSYTEFSGLTITKENVAQYLDRPLFTTSLNCMNYFVNRDKYLEVWDGTIDPHSADSIFQSYNWLKAGFKIKIVEGMRYQHTIHDKSHYRLNCHIEPHFNDFLIEQLRLLK